MIFLLLLFIFNKLADDLKDYDGASSMSSAKSNILDVYSDVDVDFDPDLPTEHKPQVKADPVKDLVVEQAKTEYDKGKSEKIIQMSMVKSGTESAEASQPAAKPEVPIHDAKTVKPVASSSLNNDYEAQEVFLLTDAIFTKKEFSYKGHKKSGKYYLPTCPNLSKLGRNSEIISNLVFRAFLDHCGTTYQRCFSRIPMIRCNSISIDDLSSIKIIYWDDSTLMIKDGYPVAI